MKLRGSSEAKPFLAPPPLEPGSQPLLLSVAARMVAAIGVIYGVAYLAWEIIPK
jgi:hypothetical protein